jgi:hypothetical protein
MRLRHQYLTTEFTGFFEALCFMEDAELNEPIVTQSCTEAATVHDHEVVKSQ